MPCEQPPATSPVTTPRLPYVVTEDWAFPSHRLPMARAARDAGFEVHVATRVSDGAAAIEAERFTLHPVPFARGSLSPLMAVSTIAALRRVRRDVKPRQIQKSLLRRARRVWCEVLDVNRLTQPIRLR